MFLLFCPSHLKTIIKSGENLSKERNAINDPLLAQKSKLKEQIIIQERKIFLISTINQDPVNKNSINLFGASPLTPTRRDICSKPNNPIDNENFRKLKVKTEKKIRENQKREKSKNLENSRHKIHSGKRQISISISSEEEEISKKIDFSKAFFLPNKRAPIKLLNKISKNIIYEKDVNDDFEDQEDEIL